MPQVIFKSEIKSEFHDRVLVKIDDGEIVISRKSPEGDISSMFPSREDAIAMARSILMELSDD